MSIGFHTSIHKSKMAAQKCFTEIISGYHYLYKSYPHLVAVNYNTHICCVAYIMEYSKLMIILTKHRGGLEKRNNGS